jgi:hypothetical protein
MKNIINIKFLLTVIFLLSASLSAKVKPTLYVCKNIQFIPDSTDSRYYKGLLINTLKKYLSETFEIDSSSTVNENRLLQFHSDSKNPANCNIASVSHCSAKYFLCVEARINTEYRTDENKDFSVPIPFPGGGMILANVTSNDTQPEYHYLTELSFSFYRTVDGKNVKSWNDQWAAENESGDCWECVAHTISIISQNIYKQINSKNPLSIFIGAHAFMLLPFKWYGFESVGNPALGGNFGLSSKVLFRNFGIDMDYSHYSFRKTNFSSNSFYIGPCIGHKIYLSSSIFSFIYPNGSIGITSFLGAHSNQVYDKFYLNTASDSLGERVNWPNMVAITGRFGGLFCLKTVPVSFEPNLKICARSGKNEKGLFSYNIGMRIGYTWDLKLFR